MATRERYLCIIKDVHQSYTANQRKTKHSRKHKSEIKTAT